MENEYNYYDDDSQCRWLSETELRKLLPGGAKEIDDWWDLAAEAGKQLRLCVNYVGMDNHCVPMYTIA